MHQRCSGTDHQLALIHQFLHQIAGIEVGITISRLPVLLAPALQVDLLADAAIALLADGEAWQAASQAGIARVERYYTDRMMFDRYRQVYAGAFARCPEAR